MPHPAAPYDLKPSPEGGPDSRSWAVAAHLSPWIVGLVGPLVVWLMKKTDPFVEEHAREALNFHLTLLLYGFVSIIFLIIGLRWGVFLLLWVLLVVAASIMVLITTIIAAVKASNGEAYRYPLTIRFVNQPVS